MAGRGKLAAVFRSRSRLVVIGIAAVALGAAGASASIVAPAPSQPLGGRVPGTPTPAAPQRPVSVAGYLYRIVVEPGLQAGEAGWVSSITYSLHGRAFGEGGGGGYPTESWPFAASGGFTIYGPGQAPKGDVVDYAVVGPNVAAVRVGARTIRTFSDSRLPAGDRAAVFFEPAASPPVTLPAPGARWPGDALLLLPLDTAGNVIKTKLPPPTPILPVRYWQAPSAVRPDNHQPPYHGPKHPLPGACELSEHGLPGLTPEFGHVIRRIGAVPNAEGELFLSCIDTEYYFHGWPLEVSVLVDAVRPGQTPGPIPGARPIIGRPNVVNLAVGQFPGSMTAQQIGEAWLVVQGGANLAQRLRVLQAIRIHKLDLQP